MKTEPTLIPTDDAVPATAFGSLERALAKCQEEAVTAFKAANGPRVEIGLGSSDLTDKHFMRAMALMKMTARLGGVMAQLNSHRSQTHFVHRTEVRTLQPPPEARLPSAEDDPEPPCRLYDSRGNRRQLTAAEADRYNAWSSRQAERERRRIEAEEAEQGTPTPKSSGSNSENHVPRIRSF
jgi:hypothetical protein